MGNDGKWNRPRRIRWSGRLELKVERIRLVRWWVREYMGLLMGV